MYALFVVLLVLGGQSINDGAMFSSMEECQEKLKTVSTIVAEFNASAENPVKIISYAAGCVAMKKAPQGKAI